MYLKLIPELFLKKPQVGRKTKFSGKVIPRHVHFESKRLDSGLTFKIIKFERSYCDSMCVYFVQVWLFIIKHNIIVL